MKFSRVFLLGILLAGAARAEVVWSDWSPVNDPWHPNRQGQLQIRVHEDTNSGQGYGDGGHMMWYQVRNTNSQWGASVPMIFPRRNPDTRQWEEAKGDLNFGDYIKPGKQVENWQMAEKSELRYTYSIRWEDDPPEEKEPPRNPSDGNRPDPGDSPGKNPPEPTEPEPEPARDLPPGSAEVLSNTVGREPDQEFQAILTFNKPDGWRDYPADYDEWKEGFLTYLQTGRRLFSYEVLEASKNSVTVKFTSIGGAELARLLAITDQAQVVVQGIRRFGTKHQPSGGAPAGGGPPAPTKYHQNGPLTNRDDPPKTIPGSRPPGTVAPTTPPKPVSSPTPGKQRYYPYWFDPSDESADKPSYFIYVRVNGEARRVRLSEAKITWGVPSDATRYTMTNYNERKKKIELDLGTHLDKP